MRKLFWIFFATALALCLFMLLFERQQQAVAVQKVPEQSQSAGSQPIQQIPQLPAAGSSTNGPHISIVPSSSNPETDTVSPQLLANWQGPIEFYGKVIDENSNPVANASVHFQWSEKPTPDGMKKADTQSDVQGAFSLQNARGLILNVSVSKAGYYSSRKDNDSYTYGSSGGAKFTPDSRNSVVFHLRKKGKEVSLIQTQFPSGVRISQLYHDGTPIFLDLLSGSQVAPGSGQLKLEFWRDISNGNAIKFDWKLQLSAADGGGLVPTDEEFAFEAPENGYQPSVAVDMPVTNQDWCNNFSAKYYIRLPNGDYGRFDINLFAHNGAFTVTSATNPTGSRNLEPRQ